MTKSLTLEELFKGHGPILTRIIESIKKGTSAKNIATVYIKPILEALEANARQSLNPLYVAYLVEYAVSQSKDSEK